MVVLGSVLTLASVTLVIAVARWTNWLNWEVLIEHPKRYVAHHPFRLAGPLTAALALSYLAALVLGWLTHVKAPKVVHPGLTMWQQALWLDRPSLKHSTIATVELKDGRKVTGMVRGFTVEQAEHRELLLGEPLAVTRRAGAAPEKLADGFMILREQDLIYVAGRYWPPRVPES
jgi:hypothetical protein